MKKQSKSKQQPEPKGKPVDVQGTNVDDLTSSPEEKDTVPAAVLSKDQDNVQISEGEKEQLPVEPKLESMESPDIGKQVIV